MATADEGGFTANANPPPYAGSVPGGKLRRQALRRQALRRHATPYDRPSTSLRGNNHEPGGLLTKIFVDPALKLISYGMERFLAPVFIKRLAAPAPPRQPGVNHCISDETQVAVLNDQLAPQELRGGECSHQSDDARANGISDLEQLLKENKLTRPEIVRLTALLQSKAAEISSDDSFSQGVETAQDFGKHKQFSNLAVGEIRDQDIRFSPSLSTPMHQAELPDGELASPAEIAKAYMGDRAVKASPPSTLGVPRPITWQGTGFSYSGAFTSKSPAMVSSGKKSVILPSYEGGFVTPRPGGRLSCTPYARDPSILKAIAYGHNGVPPCSSHYSLENGGKYSLQSTNLKRGISVLDDDDTGSIGPVRRVRQKSNLLVTPRVRSGMVESHAKQKPESLGGRTAKLMRNVVESKYLYTPSQRYAHVTSKSSEVAAKILQQLEKFSPIEISSETKGHLELEKSKLHLTATRLSGQAPTSIANIDSLILPLDMQEDKMLEDKPTKSLPESHNSLGWLDNKEKNGPARSFLPSGIQNSNLNNASPLNANFSLDRDSSIGNGAFKPPQKMNAFRMSAQEDFLVLNDDAPGPSSGSSLETSTVCKVLPSKENNLTVTRTQSDMGPSIGLIARKGPVFSSPGATRAGDKELAFAVVWTNAAARLEEPQLSVGKPEDADGSTHLFSFSSKSDDASPSLYPDSKRDAAPKLESSRSLKKVEVEEISRLIHAKKGDANGKSDIIPPAANETVPGSMPFSFGGASTREDNGKLAGSGFLFSSLSGAANIVSSSTPSLLSGSISGLPTKTDVLPFAILSQSTTTTSVAPGFSPRAEIQKSSNGSGESRLAFPAIGDANSGFFGSGFGSNFGQPTLTNLNGSTIVDPLKDLASGADTNVNMSSVFASSAYSSDTVAVDPGRLQASYVAKADANDVAVKGTAVSLGFSSSSASICTSGGILNSNFVSSSVTEPSIDKSTPKFSFGAGSSDSSSIITSGSLSNGTASVFGGFGWSSGSSSAINTVGSSSSPSNVFDASWKSSSSPLFSTTLTSFGVSSTPSAHVNSSASVFSSFTITSSSPPFSFTTTAASVTSSSSLPLSQPLSFTPSLPLSLPIFTTNAEDTMAEDPVQSSAPFPVFGQPSPPISSAAVSTFGSAVPSQPNPFFSFGRQNKVAPQGSGSLEFNAGAGGGFSMGSGGPDKSRRTVRISKVRNRKKP